MRQFKEIIVKSINLQNSTYTKTNDQINSFAPKDIYLVPKSNGKHDRYVVDDTGSISKQNGADEGDFIPITGTNNGNNVTGTIVSQARTFFDTSWESIQVGSRAYLNQSSGFIQTKSGLEVKVAPSQISIEDTNTQGTKITINPITGIKGERFYGADGYGDYDFIQFQYISSNFYTVDDINQMMIHKRFIEEEKTITQSMIVNSGYDVRVILSELMDENLERSVFYNGVFIPKSMTITSNNNDLLVKLQQLNFKPTVGDFLVIKYYKQI